MTWMFLEDDRLVTIFDDDGRGLLVETSIRM
jgi:hypothetical protein